MNKLISVKEFFKHNMATMCFLLCSIFAFLHFMSGYFFWCEILMCIGAIFAFGFLPLQKSFNILLFLHCFTMSRILYESTLNITLFSFTLILTGKYIVGVIKKKYGVNRKLLLTTLVIFLMSLVTTLFYQSEATLFMYVTYFPLIFLFFAMRKEFDIHEGMRYMLFGLIYSTVFALISLLLPNYGFNPLAFTNRFSAFFNNPNYFYMRALFVLSYYIYRFLTNSIENWKFTFVVLFCSLTTIFTQSKTGILLLALLLFILLVKYLKKDFKNRFKYVLLCFGVFLCLLLILREQFASILNRFLISSGTDLINSLTTGRDDIWGDYWVEIFSNPMKALFGQGLLSKEVYVYAQGMRRASHNLYLFLLHRFGIVGTLILAYLICLFIVESGKTKPKAAAYIPFVWFLLQSFVDNTFKSFNFTYIILVAMILFNDSEQISDQVNIFGFKRKKYNNVYEFCLKRVFDFVVALIAIIILSPIILFIYVANAIALKGNPILCQYRPGKNGKIFKLYKFRSMLNLTDEKGNLLPDDKRITKFGKLIRSLGLDELPQLFNVLKGDMSIVGPRPRLVKDMIFYDNETLNNYTVRPGVTGPAQVYDRDSRSSWERVFERDLYYKNNISFMNDIKLLVGTFVSLFTKVRNRSMEDNNKNAREYYYPDQLLKDKKITNEQYTYGIELAKTLKPKQFISYNSNLR